MSMDDAENEARLIENKWLNQDYFPSDAEVVKALALGDMIILTLIRQFCAAQTRCMCQSWIEQSRRDEERDL